MGRSSRLILVTLALILSLSTQAQTVTRCEPTGPSTITITMDNGQTRVLDFYSDHVVRIYQDPKGRPLQDPVAEPPAVILASRPRSATPFRISTATDRSGNPVIYTDAISITTEQSTGLMSVTDLRSGKSVVREMKAPVINDTSSTIFLSMGENEYFYGGGVQNGRFSHRGQSIAIENTNNWVDGGVASPTPFYWSTAGYGILAYTFRPGRYDFGEETKDQVVLQHSQDYLDLFLMVSDTPDKLISDYYTLTGRPALIPKFGYLEGHLNAYNRDYWLETTEPGKGILMEDGKRYVESQKDNGGVKESLNGERDNYHFSARAVIDRYAQHDMPLGWVLPNDGYGAGYGQEDSLDGNIENLRQYGEYAHKHGVEIGLWTQSDLHPVEGIEPLLQRDLKKEVGTAGVRVLKTDVAWVGAGYSFGLNGIADAAEIMIREGRGARPFIITLDGWAGTQRYGTVWSGDQTGGDWEYIRFHIPTYIGSGLSGMPFISSDMDGIFGGGNLPVNVRDFQWKAFTPIQLNMDGWGTNPKYPMALGEPATSINRSYLKLKSVLLPYMYSCAYETLEGTPLMRPMFYEEASPYILGSATKYQFLLGPSLLIAPIYKQTAPDKKGNDLRHGIYLPIGLWYDFFTGEPYEGGRVINCFDAPLWKLPVFVKAGAILPYAHPFNQISEIPKDFRGYALYGGADGSFVEYDDDGRTIAYMEGASVRTPLSLKISGDRLTFDIGCTEGSYDGFEPYKATEIRLNASQKPSAVSVSVGGRQITLREVTDRRDYEEATGGVFLYEESPELNHYSTKGSEAAQISIKGNPILLVKLGKVDTSSESIRMTVDDYALTRPNHLYRHTGPLQAPTPSPDESEVEAYALTPHWSAVDGADFYEIELGSMLYSTILGEHFTLEELEPETEYTLRLRAVNSDGASDWSLLTLRTAKDPYENAIKNITATTSVPNQSGQSISKLFDGDKTTTWHTEWSKEATPFDLIIDLRGVARLDSLEYYPRPDAGNGTLLEGTIAYSEDRKSWSKEQPFSWTRDGSMKTITFADKPQARYLRLHITEGVGKYGSGQEMYIYKVPGSTLQLQGDINRDGRIDENDFTSYMNYVGLRAKDADFGYMSIGDINKNGLIDAYDISTVGTVLDGGVYPSSKVVSGHVTLATDKTTFTEGEEIKILVSGSDLKQVNALSLALPYDATLVRYVGMRLIGMKDLVNLSKDRLHSDGSKEFLPTFVNRGNNFLLEDGELFEITFRALKAGNWTPKAVDGLLVDRNLNSIDALSEAE